MTLVLSPKGKIAGGDSAEGMDVAWEDQVARPIVFVVDSDPVATEMILSTAVNSRIRCEIFENCAALVDAMSRGTPDLIFLDVTTQGTNAVEVLHGLSQCAYPGVLQLTSEPGVSMVEPIRQLAQLHSLQALPPLTKPIERTALNSMLTDLRPVVSQTKLSQIRLDDAIRKGWVRFWYQPKISLQDNTLVGVEAFVRLFHPHKGLMPPAVVLKNADDAGLISLLRYALSETGEASAELSKLGLKLTVSINSTLDALKTLPATAIFRDHTVLTGHPRNWIFDVSEEDAAKNMPVVKDLGPMLRAAGVRLAIDNFSGRVLPRSVLAELPISELKLSPKFVAHCHTKSTHVDVCKALINLAHDLHCMAVAMGVETSEQSQALQRMGCDVGQGFLYGHPLPLEQLVTMIRQRSVKSRSKAAAGTP
jgi:EAL domain-containing protein (putative c-di-GMP-specific phosphodiesterase class I)